MTMRTMKTLGLVAPIIAAAACASAQPPLRNARLLYQGRNRGAEQSDTVSRKIRLGRNGQVTIQNIAGTISVTGASTDDVTIEAVKRTSGDRRQLGRVDVIIDYKPGRVDVRTDHRDTFRGDRVSVDYTVTVPDSAFVELKSISGEVKVSGVKGAVRAESISGAVTTSNTPRLELAKTVSGNVEASGVSTDGDVSASSISGSVRINGLKARGLDVNTVSGDILLRDADSERLNARSIGGAIEYNGSIERNGRYEVNSHSGPVRFTLAGNVGFELHATSFSGGIRSDFPLTVGGDRNPDIRGRRRGPGESLQATYGDGSARMSLRTFSGEIVIGKK